VVFDLEEGGSVTNMYYMKSQRARSEKGEYFLKSRIILVFYSE